MFIIPLWWYVVYPLNFRHQRLTILGLNQSDITYAQMKVWSGKNIVTFDLFEHKQTNKQATNYIDVVDGIKVSSFYIMTNRQLSSENNTKMRSDSEKSLIGFENNIRSMCKRISIYRLNSNNMATIPHHLSHTFSSGVRCCNESYLMNFVFQQLVYCLQCLTKVINYL